MAQLRAAGLTDEAIGHRVRRGRLYRVHRGVYLVGHEATGPLTLPLAALLACGPGSALSHGTAAGLWRLVEAPADEAERRIDVTIVGGGAHARPGIAVHRVGELGAPDLRRLHGLPATTPARTALDLAGGMTDDALDDLVERGRVQGILTPAAIRAAVARSPRRRGATRLLALLDERPDLTRSRAERRLLDLVRRAGLPRPQANARLLGMEVDALWREERLVAEFDSWRHHGGRASFERDRRRDARLQAAGYRVLRVTWRHLDREPERLIATLAQLLGSGAPGG